MQSTFEVHWGKHHRTYVNNLNNQIQGKDLESKSLEEVCCNKAMHDCVYSRLLQAESL